MPEPDRTVFATLLATHRDRLKLTQAALAARTEALRDAGRVPRAVTERTVAALEHLSPHRPRVPHQATIRALAMALGLTPGTRDHDAFVAAAQNPAARPADDPLAEPDAAFIAAGRETQLDRLTAAIDTAASGSASVALLTGEAGIGKSRLLDEASRRGLDRHGDAVVLWTACPRGFGTMADHEPFRAMLGQMLRDPVAGGSGGLPEVNSRRLTARVPDAARALVEAGSALVGTLVPPSTLTDPHLLDALDPELRRRVEALTSVGTTRSPAPEDIDAALGRLLARYAESGPVTLVIEDLHWTDRATLAAIRRIVHELAASRSPIALLGSFRIGERIPEDPDDVDAPPDLPSLVTERFPDAVIDLAPTIGGDAGRAFVDAAVARLHLEPLADRLFERTGGMPLFVMSFLRLHVMGGDTLDGSEVPAAIGAVFAGQMARLDERARALLAAASVQGDAFLAEPAFAAAGVLPEAGQRLLDGSLSAQVRPLGAQPVAAGIAMRRYRFAHAILRDHVLAGLSRLERSHLHLATAEALLGMLGARDHDAIETIAMQLERGGDLRRAARAWVDAGDRAMLRGGHRHAHDIYRHVRELGVEDAAPDVHVQALVGIGNSHRALGQPVEARQSLRRARREAARRGLHTVDANTSMSIGLLDFDAGRMVAGAARFAQAIDAYTRAGDTGEAARATANLSLALHGMGRYDDAQRRAESAIALVREAGDAAALASAEIALANCWLDLGHYEQAIDRYVASLAHDDANGLTHHGNVCLLNIALCNIELGHWDDAEAALDRVRAPERVVIDRMQSVVAFNGAMIAEGRGEIESAAGRYEASRAMRERLGQDPLLIDSLAGLLRVAIAAGETAKIRALLEDVQSRIANRGFVGIEHLGRLFVTLVEASDAIGDAERARSWLRDALALLTERADRLADPGDRASYLSRPPAHRRLLQLGRARGLPVPDLAAPRG
jgi:tetratricopeptide (TPR) repeat protein